MDKVVQQNAANAEESASASEELSSQAQELSAMVLELTAIVDGAGVNKTSSMNQPSEDRKPAAGSDGKTTAKKSQPHAQNKAHTF